MESVLSMSNGTVISLMNGDGALIRFSMYKAVIVMAVSEKEDLRVTFF